MPPRKRAKPRTARQKDVPTAEVTTADDGSMTESVAADAPSLPVDADAEAAVEAEADRPVDASLEAVSDAEGESLEGDVASVAMSAGVDLGPPPPTGEVL